MIELNLSEAMHGIALSKQLIEFGRRNEAFTKLAEAKKAVESTAQHRVLLLTVDAKTGFERSQSERANELLKEIATVKADAAMVQVEVVEVREPIVVFVTGTESILHRKADIMGPKEGSLSAENVGEKAFRSAVHDVGDKVKVQNAALIAAEQKLHVSGAMRRLQVRVLDIERGIPVMQSDTDERWQL